MLFRSVLAVIGNTVFATGSSLIQFVLGRAFAGAASGTFMPPAYATVASLDAEGKSERLGAMRGVDLAGFVTGPVIGGLLVGPLGLRWPFVFFAGSALVAMAIAQFPPIFQNPLIAGLYYVVAGIGWVLPAMPLIKWMAKT